MSVTTRIATGSGLLVLLMAAVLAYHIDRGTKSAAISQLSTSYLSAAALLSTQEGRCDWIADNVARFLALHEEGLADQDYLGSIERVHEDIESSFVLLSQLTLSPEHRETLKGIEAQWQSYLELFRATLAQGTPADPIEARRAWDPALDELALLKPRATELHRQLRETNRKQASMTSGDVEKAKAVSWGVAALALGLGVVVVVATARSIKRPLHRLIEATEAVAHGKFSYQLDLDRHQEFAPLAQSFNQMVRRLSELDQMKKDFVAHVSHELKNPLVAMQETNQALADELAGPLNDRQKRLLSLNIENGRRLSAMLTNLLDLSSLEAGAMSYVLKPTDVAELVCFAASVFEARAREQRLKLVVEVPERGLVVPCDRDRVIQVLDNLLDNAIKFSPPGGVIELRVEALDALPADLPEASRRQLGRAHRWAAVRVADQGAGVPDLHKQAIFRRFHQIGHNSRTHRGGVGLGLAICRELVEAHRGAIWVSNHQPQGSVFTVLLPAGEPGPEVGA